MKPHTRLVESLLWGIALVQALWTGFVVYCIWNASWSTDRLIRWMAHPITFFEYGLFPLLAALLIWIAQRWRTQSALPRLVISVLLLGLFALQWHYRPGEGHLLGHAAYYDWCSSDLNWVHYGVMLAIPAGAVLLAFRSTPGHWTKLLGALARVRWTEVVAALGILGAVGALGGVALGVLADRLPHGFPDFQTLTRPLGLLVAIIGGVALLGRLPRLGWALLASGILAFLGNILLPAL